MRVAGCGDEYVWPLKGWCDDGRDIKDRGDECLAAKGWCDDGRDIKDCDDGKSGRSRDNAVVFIKIAVTEVWPLKDGT
jgi:hypothetical protein